MNNINKQTKIKLRLWHSVGCQPAVGLSSQQYHAISRSNWKWLVATLEIVRKLYGIIIEFLVNPRAEQDCFSMEFTPLCQWQFFKLFFLCHWTDQWRAVGIAGMTSPAITRNLLPLQLYLKWLCIQDFKLHPINPNKKKLSYSVITMLWNGDLPYG